MSLLLHWQVYQRRPALIHRDGKKGVPIGCPQYLAIALDVSMLIPSVSFNTAMNMPISQLFLLRAAANELQGGPTCAWRTEEAPEDIQAILAYAQQAIDRHNASMKQNPPEIAHAS